MQLQRIALLGLGAMGAGMAANWLKKGFALSVYNRSRAKAEPLVAQGARVTATPAEAATGADIVVSVVADDVASRAVWLGADGALAAARPGAILIESSTLSPDWVLDLARRAAAKDCGFLDATLAGSKPAAAAGQVVFFVGGEAAILDKVRPALEAVSGRIQHIGDVGAGARWKLVNNMMVAIEVAAVAEALVLAGKAGFDRKRAADILAASGIASPVIQQKVARMAAGHFGDTDFALGLMLKDADYAVAFARKSGVDLAILPAAANLFRLANATGHGAEDVAAVLKAVED
jgi:3-hydroxyisobutyrate dehydrogenase